MYEVLMDELKPDADSERNDKEDEPYHWRKCYNSKIAEIPTDDLGQVFLPFRGDNGTYTFNTRIVKFNELTINVETNANELLYEVPSYNIGCMKKQSLEENIGIPIKSGLFTAEEDEILMRNWIEFCKVYQISDEFIEIFIYTNLLNKNNLKKFCMWLGRGLENRIAYALLKRLEGLYFHKRRSFTRSEHFLMKKYLDSICKTGERLTMLELAAAFYRSPGQCNRFMDVHRKKNTYLWDKELIDGEKLVTEKMLCLIVRYIAKRMANVPRNLQPCCYIKTIRLKPLADLTNLNVESLEFLWDYKLTTQIMAREPVKVNKILIKLIRIIHAQEISNWYDIKWVEIAKQFNGIMPHYLSLKFYQYILTHINYIDVKSTTEVLDELYIKSLPQLMNMRNDYQLKTFNYKWLQPYKKVFEQYYSTWT